MRRAALLLLLPLAACAGPPAPQHFVLFFPGDSNSPDANSTQVLAVAKDWAVKRPTRAVVVSGFADPPGGADYARNQTRERVRTVIQTLEAGGVAPYRIVRAADEPDDILVAPLERRRVFVDVSR